MTHANHVSTTNQTGHLAPNLMTATTPSCVASRRNDTARANAQSADTNQVTVPCAGGRTEHDYQSNSGSPQDPRNLYWLVREQQALSAKQLPSQQPPQPIARTMDHARVRGHPRTTTVPPCVMRLAACGTCQARAGRLTPHVSGASGTAVTAHRERRPTGQPLSQSANPLYHCTP